MGCWKIKCEGKGGENVNRSKREEREEKERGGGRREEEEGEGEGWQPVGAAEEGKQWKIKVRRI